MGCQQICQNSDIDNNIIIADTGSKGINRKIVNSRNMNKNLLRNEQSFTGSNFKCSMNIHETYASKDVLKVTVKATNIHKMIPIWIEKDTVITFKVSGEWGFNEHNELFSSLGCLTFEEKPNDMNFGCLIAYIQGGDIFTVTDELEYKAKTEGPLLVFQNNGLYSVNPRGYLDIEIKGGIPMSIYEVEKKLGWDLNILDTSIPEMREDEIMLLILINKVRTNPKLFSQQYLISSDKAAEAELKEILEQINPLNPLSTSVKLYNVSKNHAIDLGIHKIAGHSSSNGLTMEERLKNTGITTKVFAENCIFGYNDPLEIIMRLLVDEDNEQRNQRRIILSPDFNLVGIAIESHSGEFCWSCIQDFILDV